ncbi:MAG: hydroxyacylglutathione hydrolase [Myxococcales bacterium]|nr:hydroxyacylglutathione hydrolase [Myxococcales bacterium]
MRVERIAVLRDNYAWLLVDELAGEAAVVDPSEAAPVAAKVDALGVRLVAIWNTHHHADHVGGNEALLARYGPLRVVGSCVDRGRIPGQTDEVADGDEVSLGSVRARVLHLPAHTRGHIAYLVDRWLFCGDTLFGAGCGRLFEGTAPELRAALERLRALPDDTLVACGHEYTRANLRFALELEPGNRALCDRYARETAAGDTPTVPTLLGEEKATNPFLRWDADEVRRAVGGGEPDVVFAAVRSRKDVWRG